MSSSGAASRSSANSLTDSPTIGEQSAAASGTS